MGDSPEAEAGKVAAECRNAAMAAKADFDKARQTILDDGRLTPDAKTADLERAKAKRDAALAQLEQREITAATEALQRRQESLARPPLAHPTPEQEFAWTSTMLEGQQILDALDGTGAEQRALNLYRRWATMGNPALQRSALIVARERGWRSVIAAFADDNPVMARGIHEQQELANTLRNPGFRMGRSAIYSRGR